MTKNLSCSIFQKTYIIWLPFVVYDCKITISSCAFFIFSKFWFFGLLEEPKGKKWSKMTKTLSVASYISGSTHHIISFMVHIRKKMKYLGNFYTILQILISVVNSDVKGQRMAKNDKKLCLSHMIVIFDAYV